MGNWSDLAPWLLAILLMMLSFRAVFFNAVLSASQFQGLVLMALAAIIQRVI